MTVRVIPGDMREELRVLRDDGVRVQSIVTDPPYHLTNITLDFARDQNGTPRQRRAERGFMGKAWDGGDIAFQPATWRLCFDLLPPGGHLLAFAGTRTYHRMACAIEDAGFELRDTIAWLYGSGFPKSHNVSKGIDKAAGAERELIRVPADEVRNPKATGAGRDGMEGASRPWIEAALANGYHDKPGDVPVTDAARQWDGWGTALKPAMELICVARKPLVGTVAANVLAHGTGALNIDGCRIEHVTIEGGSLAVNTHLRKSIRGGEGFTPGQGTGDATRDEAPNLSGRWPANVVHDGSDEIVKAFPETQSGGGERNSAKEAGIYGAYGHGEETRTFDANVGSAARFFYSSKADADDRLGSKHPTVKPVDLMRWLVRLVTPPGGTVLDPFAGSGTTGMACMAEGFDCILIEREAEYVADINARIAHVHGDDTPLFRMAAD